MSVKFNQDQVPIKVSCQWKGFKDKNTNWVNGSAVLTSEKTGSSWSWRFLVYHKIRNEDVYKHTYKVI